MIVETRDNLKERPARFQMIKDLIDKKYEELIAFSILSLFNTVDEFITTSKYLMDNKVPFNFYDDRFSYDFIKVPLISSLYGLFIREMIKEDESDNYIIEDFECPFKSKKEDDKPHAV